MGFLEKITKKVTKTASAAVSENVRGEIKKETVNAIPALIGVGAVILGIVFYNNKTNKLTDIGGSMISNTHTVTNNFFFGQDEKTKMDVINKIIKEVE